MNIVLLRTLAPISHLYLACTKLFYNLSVEENSESVIIKGMFKCKVFHFTIRKEYIPGEKRLCLMEADNNEIELLRLIADMVGGTIVSGDFSEEISIGTDLPYNGFIELASELQGILPFTSIIEIYNSLPSVSRAVERALDVDLTPEMVCFIKDMAKTSPIQDNVSYNKIAVIKALREKYGCSLFKCKYYVERVMG